METKKAKQEADAPAPPAPRFLSLECLAPLKGAWAIVKHDIEKGMDPNQIIPYRTMDGGTPLLLCAISFGDATMVKYLLDKGANPSIQEPKSGNSPLHIGFFNQNTEICKLLIERGAEYIKNKKGETPVDVMMKNPLTIFVSQGFCREMIKLGIVFGRMNSTIRPTESAYKCNMEIALYRDYCPDSLFDADYLPLDLFVMIQKAVMLETEIQEFASNLEK